MQRPVNGHVFEAALIRSARVDHRCEVQTSDAFDARKIDGRIPAIADARLAVPVSFQVTTRLDHYTKLRKYLKLRNVDAEGIHLYMEVEASRDAKSAADDLAWAATAVQDMAPYGPLPVFGLRLGEDAVFYDPWAKLEELRVVRESSERLQALKRGVAFRFGRESFMVVGEDGGTRTSHYIDVDDGRFRTRLREQLGKDDAEIPVLFLPAHPFAVDVRPR